MTTDPTLNPTPHRVRVHPGGLAGRVRVPGDKSLSHRALLLGALVGEPVRVSGLAPSADVRSTAGALGSLGAEVELTADPDGNLGGTIAGPLREPDDVVDCGNAGTALRLLAGVAAGIEGLTVLTGDASLRRRPVDRILLPLQQMGADVQARDHGRVPPLVIRGGALRPITYASPVASAQVKSAVLLAGLAAEDGTQVHAPLPSRDHTERLLRYLGRDVATEIDEDGGEHTTLGAGRLTSRPIDVAGDPSSAAFWLVAGVLGAGEVTVEQVAVNPRRTGALDVLRAMGAAVRTDDVHDLAGEPVALITVAPTRLGQAEVAGALVVDAIDELPILALAGACSDGGLDVRDAAELRVKESDRIATVVAAMAALGVEVQPRPDGFTVPGGQRPTGGLVDAAGDHRIAMTACIAATVATGPVEVAGFESVATSYPSFLDDLARLGGRAETVDAGGRS